jgi:hypothetical protein
MRVATLSVAAAFVVLASDALAQTETSGDTSPTPDYTDSSPKVYPDRGLAKVGPNGSTKIVKAVPCAPYARETDGTTTCIGISGPIKGPSGSREGTTVGRSPR